MAVPSDLLPHLKRSVEDPRPIVVAMCGVAGSGKSTLAKSIINTFPNFTRLSIDQMIFDAHGLYGIDYSATLYPQYSSEADKQFSNDFQRLISSEEPKDVVLDRSFYAKDDRDEYRRLAQNRGARFVLVFFDFNKDQLWERVQHRAEGDKTADSAFEVTADILDQYVSGFEAPYADEIDVRVTS